MVGWGCSVAGEKAEGSGFACDKDWVVRGSCSGGVGRASFNSVDDFSACRANEEGGRGTVPAEKNKQQSE